MSQIQCPQCHTAFKIDERDYAEILNQVRDSAFEQRVNERLALAESEAKNSIELTKATLATQHQAECNAYLGQLTDLKTQLERASLLQQLAVEKAVNRVEREREELRSTLETSLRLHQAAETSLRDHYESRLADRDVEISRLKDFKAKLSTKMVGESLERHCENLFNAIRASAFPKAQFGKDNDATTGSKGDYIFREFEDDVEVVSIMFEMKNENDETSTKRKNEDFLKELDRDRREKGCEYAVLVSLLEPENDLYNDGILDVSHRFQKMYVVRPQFFIPIISLLRNASLSAAQERRELSLIRAQNIDITNFESNLEEFKDNFGRNWRLASDGFVEAIRRIDAAIKDLEKTKLELHRSSDNLRIANGKAEKLTIRRLTYNNPTMQARFSEAGRAR